MKQKFYAFDFDRTLGKTIKIADDFIGFVEQEDAAVGDALRAQQHSIESTGGSFDMIGALQTQLGQRALGTYGDGFVSQYRHQSGLYLEPGAGTLLNRVQAGGHDLGILTYGGEDWQTIKLRATDLDAYYRMILAEKGRKGALIASWYDAEHDVYRLPEELGGGVYKKIVFVDDKPGEFAGLPDVPSIQGYLYTGGVKPAAETSPQPAVVDLPSNVTVVDSLEDIVRHEEL